MASRTALLLWPRLLLHSPATPSSILWPSTSQIQQPSPRTMMSGRCSRMACGWAIGCHSTWALSRLSAAGSWLGGMGFCTDEEYLEFMRQAPEFERNLVRSGIILIKFWFSVTRKEQRRRFKERKSHPLKQWKLSPVDLASLDKWDEYTRAKEAMFFYTDTADAPWTVIKSDCKKRARLNAMRYVLHKVPYTNKDLATVGTLDPLLVGRANVVYEQGEHGGTPLM